MPGGKGKSIGGKGDPKGSGKTQRSHSAKAGLQVSNKTMFFFAFWRVVSSHQALLAAFTPRISSGTSAIGPDRVVGVTITPVQDHRPYVILDLPRLASRIF